MEEIRAFIAIELPEEARAALATLQAKLRAGADHPVKWVDPRSIHLTLKFLGNIPASRVGEITAAVKEAARGLAPFLLEINGLGVFPAPGRIRVVWAGLGGDLPALKQLQQRLEANLAPLGFAREARFSPHLTLCRVREKISSAEQQSLGRLVSGTASVPRARFEARTVSLMRSHLTPQGAIYQCIGSVELDKPLAKSE